MSKRGQPLLKWSGHLLSIQGFFKQLFSCLQNLLHIPLCFQW